MPTTASSSKRDAVVEYGATVVDCENALRAEVCEREMQKAREAGKDVVYFPSYDHVDVIEGNGTMMMEVKEQCRNAWDHEDDPEPNIIVCPIGGGGLLSGVSLAAKEIYGQEIQVVGVEPQDADDTYRSIKSGTWQPAVNPTRTICDGLLTASGFLTLPTMAKNVDDIILVDDKAVKRAMRFVWERMKIIIEPSSALAVAAILGETEIAGPARAAWLDVVGRTIRAMESAGRTFDSDESGYTIRVVVIISGGNVSLEKALELFKE